jgi:hypothetical protein
MPQVEGTRAVIVHNSVQPEQRFTRKYRLRSDRRSPRHDAADMPGQPQQDGGSQHEQEGQHAPAERCPRMGRVAAPEPEGHHHGHKGCTEYPHGPLSQFLVQVYEPVHDGHAFALLFHDLARAQRRNATQESQPQQERGGLPPRILVPEQPDTGRQQRGKAKGHGKVHHNGVQDRNRVVSQGFEHAWGPREMNWKRIGPFRRDAAQPGIIENVHHASA